MTFNFAMQAIDQIINSAAKTLYMSGGQMHLPDRVPRPQRRGRARRGPAQPGLFQLVRPCAGPEGGRALRRRRRQGPAEGRHPRPQSRGLPRARDALRPRVRRPRGRGLAGADRQGQGRAAPGTDVTLIAHSRMVGLALEAAEELAKEGIEAEVIDLRTLRPLDHDTVVASVKKTNRLVTVEEGWGPMGVGAEVAARVVEDAFDYLDAPPRAWTRKTCRCPMPPTWKRLSLPSVDKIVKAAKAVCYR